MHPVFYSTSDVIIRVISQSELLYLMQREEITSNVEHTSVLNLYSLTDHQRSYIHF